MHHATALVFALCFASLVAAAPVAPISITSSSSDASTTGSISPAVAAIAVPAEILPAVAFQDQSESYSHAPESVHSAEKSRRRSFRRRHP